MNKTFYSNSNNYMFIDEEQKIRELDFFLFDNFENIKYIKNINYPSDNSIFLYVYNKNKIQQIIYNLNDFISFYDIIEIKNETKNKSIALLLPKNKFNSYSKKNLFIKDEIKKSPLIKEIGFILKINLMEDNYELKEDNEQIYNKKGIVKMRFIITKKDQINNINNNYFLNSNSNIINNNNSKDEIIKSLKNELNNSKLIIEEQKEKIKDLENKLNNENVINKNNSDFIISLQNAFFSKEEELIKLKEELHKNKIKLSNYSQNENRYSREQMMCVNFISTDHKVQFAVPCTNTDIFAEVEEKLYKQFPEYRETNNYFLARGQQVLRFKTIADNNIGNGLPVTLIVQPLEDN